MFLGGGAEGGGGMRFCGVCIDVFFDRFQLLVQGLGYRNSRRCAAASHTHYRDMRGVGVGGCYRFRENAFENLYENRKHLFL